MRKHRKILASATVTAFVLAVLMACCWQKVMTASGQLARISHLPACHQQAAAKADKNNPQSSCQCQQLVSIAPEKSMLVKIKETGYLKWIFESPSKAKSVTLYSFPTLESSMSGPPSRYASAPLYIKNPALRV